MKEKEKKQRPVVQILPPPPQDEALVNKVMTARLNTLYAEKALIERTIHLITTMLSLGMIKSVCSSETVSGT